MLNRYWFSRGLRRGSGAISDIVTQPQQARLSSVEQKISYCKTRFRAKWFQLDADQDWNGRFCGGRRWRKRCNMLMRGSQNLCFCPWAVHDQNNTLNWQGSSADASTQALSPTLIQLQRSGILEIELRILRHCSQWYPRLLLNSYTSFKSMLLN